MVSNHDAHLGATEPAGAPKQSPGYEEARAILKELGYQQYDHSKILALMNWKLRPTGWPSPQQPDAFTSELCSLLNKFSQENASDTPDFILTKFLIGCLLSWNASLVRREEWYGRKTGGGAAILDKPTVIPGLSLNAAEDGTWLTFRAANSGASVTIKLEVVAEKMGASISRNALENWCAERRAEQQSRS